MGGHATTGLTRDDLRRFPDDGLRRELIDGVLHGTPAPATRHQLTVVEVIYALGAHSAAAGGSVLTAPFDAKFSAHDVTEPDVLFVTDPSHLGEKSPTWRRTSSSRCRRR